MKKGSIQVKGSQCHADTAKCKSAELERVIQAENFLSFSIISMIVRPRYSDGCGSQTKHQIILFKKQNTSVFKLKVIV